MEKRRHQLELAGNSLEQVREGTVFVTDMKLFQSTNQAYRTKKHQPGERSPIINV